MKKGKSRSHGLWFLAAFVAVAETKREKEGGKR